MDQKMHDDVTKLQHILDFGKTIYDDPDEAIRKHKKSIRDRLHKPLEPQRKCIILEYKCRRVELNQRREKIIKYYIKKLEKKGIKDPKELLEIAKEKFNDRLNKCSLNEIKALKDFEDFRNAEVGTHIKKVQNLAISKSYYRPCFRGSLKTLETIASL